MMMSLIEFREFISFPNFVCKKTTDWEIKGFLLDPIRVYQLIKLSPPLFISTVSWYNPIMTISNQPAPINDDLRLSVIEAIRRAQTRIQWKAGKDARHLSKRIRLGHLPAKTTLTEYETIISSILNDNEAKVYLFLYDNTPYPTVVAPVQNRVWLVMIGLNSIMETAFPPNDPESYLADPAYVYLSRLKELQL